LDVKKYWEAEFDDEEARKGAAARIFGTFLENNQPLQVNAKTEYVQKDRKTLASLDESLFASVYREIYSMLHLLYQQFETDEIYKNMVSELTMGDNSRDSLTSFSAVNAGGSIYPLVLITPSWIEFPLHWTILKVFTKTDWFPSAAQSIADGSFDDGFTVSASSDCR
jgi:hypothetical protein